MLTCYIKGMVAVTELRKHHLSGVPKTDDHRAQIAASKVLRAIVVGYDPDTGAPIGMSRDDDPERWQAEYDIALFKIQRRPRK